MKSRYGVLRLTKTCAEQIEALLNRDISGVEKMKTRLRKYDIEFKIRSTENAELESKLRAAQEAGKEKIANRLKYAGMEQELRELHKVVDSIHEEILAAAKEHAANKRLEK